MLGPDLRRQHLIKPGVAVVHDPLGGSSDLGTLIQRRGLLHHAPGNIENDRRLLPIGRSAVHFGGRLVISVEQVQSDRGRQLGLSVFLSNLHIGSTELPMTILIHDPEDVPDDLFLPRQQPEWLPVPFTLGVLQVLNKSNGPICFRLIIMRSRKHESGRFIIGEFRVIRRPHSGH